MPKKNIIIAGGGFAGVSALRRLGKYRRVVNENGYEIILVNEKDDFEFIPMLPDVIGGWMDPERLKRAIRELAAKAKCQFVKGRIEKIDLDMKTVNLKNNALPYEYLILSAGSCTNFYNIPGAVACLKLDNIDDALKIKFEILKLAVRQQDVRIVIIGGGYTGIEIATNIVSLFRSLKTMNYHVMILEKEEDILMNVPKGLRHDVRDELKKMDIEIVCAESFKSFSDEYVICNSGQKFKAQLCLWNAGVKSPSFLDVIKVKKEKTRIRVEPSLIIQDSIYKNIFVTGDDAAFMDKTGKTIRMAVMFSMGQGKIAAENVVRSILKRPLIEYEVRDLGYLIPMAHGKASGIVLNMRVHGFLGFVLHYAMCIYRSEWKNKFGIIQDLIRKFMRK